MSEVWSWDSCCVVLFVVVLSVRCSYLLAMSGNRNWPCMCQVCVCTCVLITSLGDSIGG